MANRIILLLSLAMCELYLIFGNIFRKLEMDAYDRCDGVDFDEICV